MYNFAGLFIRTLKENYSDEQVHHALEMVDQAYDKQMEVLLQNSGNNHRDLEQVPEPLRQMMEEEIIAFMDVFREFGKTAPSKIGHKEVKDYNIIKAYQKMIQTD